MSDTGSIRRASRRVSGLFNRKKSGRKGSNESLLSIFEDDTNALPQAASEGPFAPKSNPPPIGSKRTISPATSFHEELARKTNKLSIEDDTSSQQSATGSSGSDKSTGTARSILPGPQASAFVPPAGIAPLSSVVPDSQDPAFHQRAFTPEDPNSMKSPIAINMVTPAQQYAAGINLQRPSPTTWAPSPIPNVHAQSAPSSHGTTDQSSGFTATPSYQSSEFAPAGQVFSQAMGQFTTHGPIEDFAYEVHAFQYMMDKAREWLLNASQHKLFLISGIGDNVINFNNSLHLSKNIGKLPINHEDKNIPLALAMGLSFGRIVKEPSLKTPPPVINSPTPTPVPPRSGKNKATEPTPSPFPRLPSEDTMNEEELAAFEAACAASRREMSNPEKTGQLSKETLD
ncbi:hypothetical protein P691DRAFT_764268, partial [Macrolepiota fuliginosa MF-IS2]